MRKEIMEDHSHQTEDHTEHELLRWAVSLERVTTDFSDIFFGKRHKKEHDNFYLEDDGIVWYWGKPEDFGNERVYIGAQLSVNAGKTAGGLLGETKIVLTSRANLLGHGVIIPGNKIDFEKAIYNKRVIGRYSSENERKETAQSLVALLPEAIETSRSEASKFLQDIKKIMRSRRKRNALAL